MNKLAELLLKHHACDEARDWASQYETLAEAWGACERGDWMLWLAGRAGLCSRQELSLAACACARLALVHVLPGEKRPRMAIETTKRWARGAPGVTRGMVRGATDAAYAAYADAILVASDTSAATLAAARAAALAAASAAALADATFVASAASAAATFAATAIACATDAAAWSSAGTASTARAHALRACAHSVRVQSVEGKWRLVCQRLRR